MQALNSEGREDCTRSGRGCFSGGGGGRPSTAQGRDAGDGIELPESGAGGVTDERLRGFFQEAEAVKAEMAAICDALDRIDAANEGKSLHQADALRAHRSRVNAEDWDEDDEPWRIETRISNICF